MSYTQAVFGRHPIGDHQRRVSLGLSLEEFARRAGITVEELCEYEFAAPTRPYDPEVAQRIGEVFAEIQSTTARH